MRIRTILLAVLAGCLGAVGSAAAQGGGPTTWRSIGPGVGGANFAIGFHPEDPRIMLAGTDMGSMFRTDDGGRTWTMLGCPATNPGYRGGWSAVFDHKRPNIAWAAHEHGVNKSEDGGITWRRMTAPIGGTPLAFQGIALDPTDTDIVYICQGWVPRGIKSWSRGLVWKSTDGGETWTELPRPGGPREEDAVPVRSYTGLAVDPNSPFEAGRGHARVFVYGRGGLFVSEDAGGSWVDLAESLPPGEVNDLALADVDGETLAFVSLTPVRPDAEQAEWVGGIYRSADAGRTWAPVHRNIERPLSTLARINGPRVRLTLLLAHSPAAPRRIYAGSAVGVFRSDDLGENWEQITRPNREWFRTEDWDGAVRHYSLRRHGGNFVNSYKGGIDHFNLFAAAHGNADFVAFTDNVTTYVTTDGGETWEDALFDYTEPFDEGRFGDRPPTMYTRRIRSRGAQVIVPLDVAVDPFDPETLFVAYMDLSLRISRDGGESWEYPTRNIVAAGRGQGEAQSVAFDPAVRGRAWVSFGSHGGRVYRTDDGGVTFRMVGIQPLLDEAEKTARDRGEAVRFRIHRLALDPTSPEDARVLYAATDFGMYKTEDGGETWQDISYGLPAEAQMAHMELDPQNPEILYVGHSHRLTSPDAGLYRTTDGGRNWVRLAPDSIGALRSVSLCASVPNVLYAVASAPGARGGAWTPSRLWRSADRGETWRLLDERLAGSAAVHPNDPDYVYYATYAQNLNEQAPAIWRSRDGGQTWEEIAPDIPLALIRRFTFDVTDPTRFFALNSFCVYEGRDPDAPAVPAAGGR